MFKKYISISLKEFIKSVKLFLILPLLTDIVFILLHILYVYGIIDHNENFSLEKDMGYAELFQYIKEYWIFLILFYMALKSKKMTYGVWSFIFLYLLLDDSLEIHEHFGFYLSNYFNFAPTVNLRPIDFGELLVTLMFGGLFMIFLAITYMKAQSTEKKITKDFLLLLILLAFFGVFVDMMHIALSFGKNILALIEDGGELLVMSFMFWYAVEVYRKNNITSV